MSKYRRNKQWERVQCDVAAMYREDLTIEQLEELENRQRGSDRHRQDVVRLNRVLANLECLSEDAELLAMVGKPQRADSHSRGRSAGFRWQVGLSFTCVLLGMAALWFAVGDKGVKPIVRMDRYVTQVGEQKQVTLSDGTRVLMNTATLMTVAYSEQERVIRLERGQAFFEVVKEPERQFEVQVGQDRVTVLGTAFDLYLMPKSFRLAVTEGVVALHGGEQDLNPIAQVVDAGAEPQQLQHNLQYKVSVGTVVERDWGQAKTVAWHQEDLGRLTSWCEGIIEFSGVTLSEVVKELNRYTGKKILIESTEAMDLRLFATVRLDNTDEALSAIELSLPIEIARHFDRIVITKKTPKN